MLRILMRSAGPFLLATVFATTAAQWGAVRSRANLPECKLYPLPAGTIAPTVPSLPRRSAQAGPFPSNQFRLPETISGSVQFPGSAFGNRTESGILPGPARLFAGNFRQDPVYREREISRDMLEMMAIFVVVLTVIGALTWIIRTVIDHRRWIRMSKVQTEAHSKLLDRLTSNEDLLAYIQTPAGRRFLESTPIESGMQVNAPISRIMWSIQAGLVLGAG